MALSQVIEIANLLDSSRIDGKAVASFLRKRGLKQITVERIEGQKSCTDLIQIKVKGKVPKDTSKPPTLGIVGMVGGVGARPKYIGLVSDGDGAVGPLACALKLADMQTQGDFLPGDVIISTHVSPCAPTRPHHPVDFMDCPVDRTYLRRKEVYKGMDAILTLETARGNRIINHKGIAITPTVLQGYILKVSDHLMDIYQYVTGRSPVIFPLTTQDITPQTNGLYHINGIAQSACFSDGPLVGVAFTTSSIVPGCATGASQPLDVELGVRFCIEVGKSFNKGLSLFYDKEEFDKIISYYGTMNHLQTIGKARSTMAG